MVKADRKRMRGSAPSLERVLFSIDCSRFEVHFSCSVHVLRRDSASAHVSYGLRTYLDSLLCQTSLAITSFARVAFQFGATDLQGEVTKIDWLLQEILYFTSFSIAFTAKKCYRTSAPSKPSQTNFQFWVTRQGKMPMLSNNFDFTISYN